MDIEREKPRSELVSDLLAAFIGPLPDKSRCHICLDPWHSTSSSNEENDVIICCLEPVRINHRNCRCYDIVIGRNCITTWLLEKDTCPMCRGDLVEALPPHLRDPPPLEFDDEISDNEDAGILAESTDEEYIDELEEQSWLYSDGNYLHPTTITSGEQFTVADIIELFLSKPKIEALKTEAEKTEFYTTLGMHTVGAWDTAYKELVEGKPQVVEDLFTVHGPVCIDGVKVDP